MISPRYLLLVASILFFFSLSSGVQARDVSLIPEEHITLKDQSYLFTGSDLFIRTPGEFIVQIPQGQVQIKRGFAYLLKQEYGYLLQGLHGEIHFTETRTRKTVNIPPMTQIRIYLDGQVSIMKALDFKMHLLSFQKHFKPSRSQMKNYAQLLGVRVRISRDRVGQYYSDLYQRSVASSQQKGEVQELKEKKQINLKQRLRRLYEQKVFGFDLDKDPPDGE